MEAICYISRDRLRISCRDIHFFYRVFHQLPCMILRQIRERILPTICTVKLLRPATQAFDLGTIHLRNKLYLNRIRTFVVAIVIIVPRLGNRYFRFLWCIAVRDVVATDLRRIICDLILRYCIRDLLSRCILRQIRERILPPVFFCNSLAFFHLSIRKKVHRDRFRSLSVLIVCVVPRLCSADLGRLRRFFILNRQFITIIIDIF